MAEAKITAVLFKRSRSFRGLLCAALVLGCWSSAADAQTCDQTLSVGANVASAVSGAANGSTVCLNSGNYGTVGIGNVHKSSFVTLAAAPGATPSMTLTVSNSSRLRFQGLSFQWSSVMGTGSHHIEYVNARFVPNGDGLNFNMDTDTPPSTDQAFVVDGCDFTDVGKSNWAGRLSVRGVNGLKIRNTLFSGNTTGIKSDGVMLIGGSKNVDVGPGNTFHTILQSAATQGEHIDPIQIFGAGSGNRIIGNRFYNSDIFIMAPDGSSTVTVENNVFDGQGSPGTSNKIQFGNASNPVFRHNVVRNVVASFDSKPADSASSNLIAENNAMVSASFTTASGNGCNNCTFRYNLFSSSGSASGTDNVIGSAVFVGGSSPSTYAGFGLAAGSPGKGAGNDGLDMGLVLSGDPQPEPTPPVITSALTATGTAGQPFQYQIVATNDPDSYGGGGSGQSVNASTGLVSGLLPAQAGTVNVPISATNEDGTDSETLVIAVTAAPVPTPPVITSPLTLTCTAGEPCEYQIVATNDPDSYGASNTPVGWAVNASTGLIAGAIAVDGTYSIGISATNTDGADSETLVVTVNEADPDPEPPTITPGETVLSFTHDGVDTDSYELCWDDMAGCVEIAPSRQVSTDVWHFVVPADGLPAGAHEFVVMAVGPAGSTPADEPRSFTVPEQAPPAPVAPGALSIQ